MAEQQDLQRLKQLLHHAALTVVQDSLNRIESEIQELQRSANEETKSSAGDKYETGRAMIQLEIEKLLVQKSERLAALQVLNSLPSDKIMDHVQPGAIAQTSTGNFYLSTNAGEVTCEGIRFFTLSTKSPVGQLLLGKKEGETIYWNGKPLHIKSVW